MANERARLEIAELRAERDAARAEVADLQVANVQVRARVREFEEKLEKLKKCGPREMPGLKPSEPDTGAEARHGSVGRAATDGRGTPTSVGRPRR